MPSISQLRIQPGTGNVVPAATTSSSSAASSGTPPTLSQVSFTVQTPSTGIALYDSATVTGNSIVLGLRNLVAGAGIAVNNANGLITITCAIPAGPTGPTGPAGTLLDTPAIAIGSLASTDGFSPVAIGYYSSATGGTASTAVGSNATATGTVSSAFGYQSQATANYAVAMGTHSTANETYAVALGSHTSSVGWGSIAIGGLAHTGSVQYGAIAIGFESQAAIYGAVAVGPYTHATAGRTTAIGSYAYAHQAGGVALGHWTGAIGAGSVAIGINARAHDVQSNAIGGYSAANYAYSTVIGNNTSDTTRGSFVVSGFNAGRRPAEHRVKFVGQTQGAQSARASWGNGSYTATVSFATPGTMGNGYGLAITRPGANHTLDVTFSSPNLSINLGTTSGGGYDSGQNTLANIAALFPAYGFSFGYTSGYGSSVVAFTTTESFSGGTGGNPTVVLTADGASEGANNVPQLWQGTVATVSGRVVAVDQTAFTSGGDMASFVLSPVLVLRDDSSNYHLSVPAEFTLESGTENALTWPVPTLVIDMDPTKLRLTVSNDEVANLDWMGFLTFESSSN